MFPRMWNGVSQVLASIPHLFSKNNKKKLEKIQKNYDSCSVKTMKDCKVAGHHNDPSNFGVTVSTARFLMVQTYFFYYFLIEITYEYIHLPPCEAQLWIPRLFERSNDWSDSVWKSVCRQGPSCFVEILLACDELPGQPNGTGSCEVRPHPPRSREGESRPAHLSLQTAPRWGDGRESAGLLLRMAELSGSFPSILGR